MRKRRKPIPVFIILAICWLSLVFFTALFADLIMPMDYLKSNLPARLSPPGILTGNSPYLLGTDQLGRDLLSRLIRSIRTSMLISFIGAVLTMIFGTTIGVIAAHFKGWVDELVSLLVDFQYALPFMVLAMMVIAFFGSNMVLFVILLGFQGWMRYARVTRAMSLAAQEHGYAIAGKALGMHPARLYLVHIIPNMANVIIVQLTLNFPSKILVETTLSFLGMGVQPPEPSLGSLLSSGREYLMSAPWIAVVPGMVIFITTLSMSILGDWLQDKLDPTRG